MEQHSSLHRLNSPEPSSYSFINPESIPIKQSKEINNMPNNQQQSATSKQIIQNMKKKPYTQFLKGTQLTYSLLPKKQATFVLTHQRFLMLRSIQSISYARIFPQQQELPFRSLKDVLTPKTSFDLLNILEVQSGKDQKLIINFTAPATTWQFHCPSSICAEEWRRKINQAINLRKQYHNSGYKSMDQFLFDRHTRSNKNDRNIIADQDYTGKLAKSIFDSENPQNNISFSHTQSLFDTNMKKKPSDFVFSNTTQNQPYNSLATNHTNNFSMNSQTNHQNIYGRNIYSSDTSIKNHSLGKNHPPYNSLFSPDSLSTPVRRKSIDLLGDSLRKDIGNTLSIQKANSGFNMSNQMNNSNYLNNTHLSNNKYQSISSKKYTQVQSNYSQPSISSLQKYPLGVSADSWSRNQNSDFKILNKGNINNISNNSINDFITNNSFNKQPYDQPFHGRSISRVNIKQRQLFLDELDNYKRSWVAELACDIEKQLQFGELMIDFKNYVEKVTAVMISQLYLPKKQKIFPEETISKDKICYQLDDIYIEIYFITPDTIESKHQRYRQAALQFKNFDYLLSTLEGSYNLIIPLFVLFQHKGFFGMAKSKYGNNLPIKNKEFYQTLNKETFQQIARISASTFLNQKKCRIVQVKQTTNLSDKYYYVDRLTQLLPLQKGQSKNNTTKVLRPEFIQSDNFDNIVFRDKKRQATPAKLLQQINEKIKIVLNLLQNEQEYFTNSKDLSQLIHQNGLNLRMLGNLMQKTKLIWLKKILRTEILARSLKNIFRYDIQNCIRNQATRIANNQNQNQRESKKVINFLNIIFGLPQSSNQIWNKAINFSKKHFQGFTFANMNDINISYFLQAIQIHFKIVLSEKIHFRKFFTSNQTFQFSDFIRFQFDTTFCNLNWTSLFVEISQCLEMKSPEMFEQLKKLIYRTTRSGIPYLHILQKYPIYDRICQYLLDFNSPEENKELYNRLQASFLPKKYIFQSKFAQIKWYLKANKIQQANNSVKYLGTQVFKWFGEDHPLFVQINRIFAMYYCDQKQNQQYALKYATTCLEMHKKIHGENSQIVWRDYLLMGKAYFAIKNIQAGMHALKTAKQLVKVSNLSEYESFAELNLLLCKGQYLNKDYQKAYNLVMELYSLIKSQTDKQMLFYIIQTVSWMKHILDSSGQYQIYYLFLEKQFSQHFRALEAYPDLLVTATKMATIPSLKHAILRRSKNKIRLMTLVEQLAKMAFASKVTLTNYINSKIHDSTFPINLLTSLSSVDRIVDQIIDNELFQKWSSFFRTSDQASIDKLSRTDMNQGIEFLVNVTALFHCFGKYVLDELHIKQQ